LKSNIVFIYFDINVELGNTFNIRIMKSRAQHDLDGEIFKTL